MYTTTVHVSTSTHLFKSLLITTIYTISAMAVGWGEGELNRLTHTQSSTSHEEQFRETFTMSKHTHGRHSRSGNCIGKSRAMRWVVV